MSLADEYEKVWTRKGEYMTSTKSVSSSGRYRVSNEEAESASHCTWTPSGPGTGPDGIVVVFIADKMLKRFNALAFLRVISHEYSVEV